MFEAQLPDGDVEPVDANLRAQIAACDAKIARYKATLDAGPTPLLSPTGSPPPKPNSTPPRPNPFGA